MSTVSQREIDQAHLKREFWGAQFQPHLQRIDRYMADYLGRFDHPDKHYGMIEYHLGFAGSDLKRLSEDEFLPRGKRLRPILCMLMCRAMKVPDEVAGIVMLASEVMHCASLAHDDVQDKDAVRWGRPTINSLFGAEQAINVGDALIGLVYQLLLQLRNKGIENSKLLDVIEVFNNTHLRMCEGQHLDLYWKCDQEIEIDEYFDMVSRKTASPCDCIASTISILASCSEAVTASLYQFSHSLGVLYQVCDDIRGIWSEQESLGRSVGQDITMHRAALPLLYGFKYGSKNLRDVLLGRFEDALPPTVDQLQYIREELNACGVDRLCYRHAEGLYKDAISALRSLNNDGSEIMMLEHILTTCFASIRVNGRAPGAED